MTNPITPLTPSQMIVQENKTAQEGWFRRSITITDIWVNVVIFRGRMGETISSRAARAALEGKRWGILMSDFLIIFQSDHGAKAIAGDLERAQSIESTEGKIE